MVFAILVKFLLKNLYAALTFFSALSGCFHTFYKKLFSSEKSSYICTPFWKAQLSIGDCLIV
jgi:hypothetical protein